MQRARASAAATPSMQHPDDYRNLHGVTCPEPCHAAPTPRWLYFTRTQLTHLTATAAPARTSPASTSRPPLARGLPHGDTAETTTTSARADAPPAARGAAASNAAAEAAAPHHVAVSPFAPPPAPSPAPAPPRPASPAPAPALAPVPPSDPDRDTSSGGLCAPLCRPCCCCTQSSPAAAADLRPLPPAPPLPPPPPTVAPPAGPTAAARRQPNCARAVASCSSAATARPRQRRTSSAARACIRQCHTFSHSPTRATCLTTTMSPQPPKPLGLLLLGIGLKYLSPPRQSAVKHTHISKLGHNAPACVRPAMCGSFQGFTTCPTPRTLADASSARKLSTVAASSSARRPAAATAAAAVSAGWLLCWNGLLPC